MYYNTYIRLIALIIGLIFNFEIIADDGPWRLNNFLPSPGTFSISGQHRARFETLDEQFRGARNGGDQSLMLRTLVQVEIEV